MYLLCVCVGYYLYVLLFGVTIDNKSEEICIAFIIRSFTGMCVLYLHYKTQVLFSFCLFKYKILTSYTKMCVQFMNSKK